LGWNPLTVPQRQVSDVVSNNNGIINSAIAVVAAHLTNYSTISKVDNVTKVTLTLGNNHIDHIYQDDAFEIAHEVRQCTMQSCLSPKYTDSAGMPD
jgi:hypothetical protein